MADIHYNEDTLASRALDFVYGRAGSYSGDPHVAGCKTCLEKLRFFESYYRAFQLEFEQDILMGEKYRGRYVALTPFVRQAALGGMAARPSQVILAAQGMASDDRFVEVMVYSSSDPPVILRVIEDRQLHSYKAFILSEPPALKREIRLSFVDDNGKTASALADVKGCADLAVPSGFNWKASHVGIIIDQP